MTKGKTFAEMSKKHISVTGDKPVTLDELKFGCLQRIANSLDTMANLSAFNELLELKREVANLKTKLSNERKRASSYKHQYEKLKEKL